ncbi:MAG: amidase [Planctomycetota bacterium]|nr:MAG: amidase [Planctomycetota bacterium]
MSRSGGLRWCLDAIGEGSPEVVDILQADRGLPGRNGPVVWERASCQTSACLASRRRAESTNVGLRSQGRYRSKLGSDAVDDWMEDGGADADSMVARRRFLALAGGFGIGAGCAARTLLAQATAEGRVTPDMVAQAAWLSGVDLDDEQAESLSAALNRTLRSFHRLRSIELDADEPPALVFRPDFFYQQAWQAETSSHLDAGRSIEWSLQSPPARGTDEDIALADIATQARWLAAGDLSSVELTEIYLRRLERYDPVLNCVVTLLSEHAIEQAIASDRRRARGRPRGVLDGIPWVAKDLIAVPPFKTTWGAEPFRDQIRQEEATVSRRLRQAGAVLLAKVSLGALAWGDRWFGGQTRNPWNPQQGSSGSSAGSAASVAAGLASFALGSETLGSIVSPCRRCRTCGLRPTFGRVSRAGCMPLAWSMDKIGPIARSVSDLGYVFAQLIGPDRRDPTLVDQGFTWPRTDPMGRLRVGVPAEGRLSAMERQAVDWLDAEGAAIVPVDLPTDLPRSGLQTILGVEAATVFDDAFRSDPDADYGNWPETFRESQMLPAVPYLRANRLRSRLVAETEANLINVDVMVGGDDLLLTNLTGHPSLVVACGADTAGDDLPAPDVIKLTASAYRESMLLHVGAAIQQAFPPSPRGPNLDRFIDLPLRRSPSGQGSSE